MSSQSPVASRADVASSVSRFRVGSPNELGCSNLLLVDVERWILDKMSRYLGWLLGPYSGQRMAAEKQFKGGTNEEKLGHSFRNSDQGGSTPLLRSEYHLVGYVPVFVRSHQLSKINPSRETIELIAMIHSIPFDSLSPL